MTLWLAPHPLVLASASAVRRTMLASAGIPVEVRPADIDERALEATAASAEPGKIAALLAREKAMEVARLTPGRLTVGADQTLALGSRRFSKPRDRAAARQQILELRGKTHELHSAVAVVRDTELLYTHTDVARLTMRPFDDDFLERFLDAADSAVTESVGGYQLEKIGIHLFERIDGGHFTILGLPLLPLLEFFRKFKVLA